MQANSKRGTQPWMKKDNMAYTALTFVLYITTRQKERLQPNPNHVLHRLLPQPKTPVITFVNAHTISHYLQTSVLSWNRTLYIECCSEISINLVFRSQCYFASTFYSTAYVFRIISFRFLSCILLCVACAFVICLIKYLLTYLLTNNEGTH